MKLVVVGDEAVGKTRLLNTYAGKVTQDYIPTLFDSPCALPVTVGGDRYSLITVSVAGLETLEGFRGLCYGETDVVLICFSVGNPESFDNVRHKWVPEIRARCPNKPYILVATQIDLRNNADAVEQMSRNGKKPISTTQGRVLAREVNAWKYLECSVVTRQGLQNIFKEAVVSVIRPLDYRYRTRGWNWQNVQEQMHKFFT